MADKTTYIKLDRNIINWRWYKSPKILSVFLWLLIKANIKEGHFEKDTINKGSLVTSNAHIANACGLTISNVRTALANLETTGEISREVRNHYQIITIVNYDAYQSAIPKTAQQLASNLDSNSQSTLMATRNNQRIKEYKNVKKERIPPKSPKGDSSPSGDAEEWFETENGRVKRGTDEFRNISHLLFKTADEGTMDDMPLKYRPMYDNYADYWRYRNQ